MSFKRLYKDVEGVCCPICGAPVVRDLGDVEKARYFCTGKTLHNLTSDKSVIKAARSH